MEILIQVSSGYSDSIIPSLFMAMRFKNEGKDVAVLFEWRVLIAFAEKKFEYSPSLTKYKHEINTFYPAKSIYSMVRSLEMFLPKNLRFCRNS